MGLFAAAAASLIGFAILGLAARSAAYFPFDPPITEAVQAQAWLGPVAAVGSVVPLILLVLTVPLLWLRRSHTAAVVVGAGVLVAGVLGELVKRLVERPRPDLPSVQVFETASGFSFPSGAIVLAAALFVLLAFTITSAQRSRRALIWLGAVVALALLSVARIYSGVHWPSDVLGGLLLGVSVAAIAWGLARSRI